MLNNSCNCCERHVTVMLGVYTYILQLPATRVFHETPNEDFSHLCSFFVFDDVFLMRQALRLKQMEDDHEPTRLRP